MIRKESVKIIVKYIKNDPIISANGFMSRDVFELNEKESNFYIAPPEIKARFMKSLRKK
jgi:sulfopyruvate decarboxylase subunit beta